MMEMLHGSVIAGVMLPLFSGLVSLSGLFSERLTGRFSQCCLALAFLMTLWGCYLFSLQSSDFIEILGYTWLSLDVVRCDFGFWVDGLSLSMLLMVTFVSFLIHVYSVDYMRDDPGFCRFMGLISLFTFSMSYLVMANNIVGLFFGWEGVSLFSYFLIGYYYFKDSAARANVKAFLINRFGDLGFFLGLALLIYCLDSTQYVDLFPQLSSLGQQELVAGTFSIRVVNAVGLLLFLGVMSKSAQIPLYIWLPDSMEGPTPVSALIHAATMVTSGIYLLCRFYMLVDQSLLLQNFMALIGASGAFGLGLLALVENDIKRIIAYSTLSQLGYMVVAVGVGAYSAAIFHLISHAFFKALLFLAAGSVILALHHEQDIRKMGGLYRFMPVTTLCFLIGALCLSGIPPLAGFYSKDLIVAAVLNQYPYLYAGGLIYVFCLLGFIVTPLYIFRLFLMVFCNQATHGHEHVFESRASTLLVLLVLALMSILFGFAGVSFFVGNGQGPTFYDFQVNSSLGQSMLTGLQAMVAEGVFTHAVHHTPLYLSVAGVVLSWFIYGRYRYAARQWYGCVSWFMEVLSSQYGLDWVNNQLVCPASLWLSRCLNRYGEKLLIDDTVEYRLARRLNRWSFKASRSQGSVLSGYFKVMIACLVVMVGVSAFKMVG